MRRLAATDFSFGGSRLVARRPASNLESVALNNQLSTTGGAVARRRRINLSARFHSDYEKLLEDLDDLAVVTERRDEPTIPHEQFVSELKRLNP